MQVSEGKHRSETIGVHELGLEELAAFAEVMACITAICCCSQVKLLNLAALAALGRIGTFSYSQLTLEVACKSLLLVT